MSKARVYAHVRRMPGAETCFSREQNKVIAKHQDTDTVFSFAETFGDVGVDNVDAAAAAAAAADNAAADNAGVTAAETPAGLIDTDIDKLARHDADAHIPHSAVTQLLGGDDVDVVVAGTSGSGKSFLLGWGDAGAGAAQPANRRSGLVPRALCTLFGKIDDDYVEENLYVVEASVYEVYCERVYDLLDPVDEGDRLDKDNDPDGVGAEDDDTGATDAAGATRGKGNGNDHERGATARFARRALPIHDRPPHAPWVGPRVELLKRIRVDDADQVIGLIERALRARAFLSNMWHQRTELAHMVLRIGLVQRKGRQPRQYSTMRFFELGGHEARLSPVMAPAGVDHDRLYARSLLTQSADGLGTVVSALAKVGRAVKAGKMPDRRAIATVPFGSSVLTTLLRRALRCESQLMLVVTVNSGDSAYFDHAVDVLRWADKVQQLQPLGEEEVGTDESGILPTNYLLRDFDTDDDGDGDESSDEESAELAQKMKEVKLKLRRMAEGHERDIAAWRRCEAERLALKFTTLEEEEKVMSSGRATGAAAKRRRKAKGKAVVGVGDDGEVEPVTAADVRRLAVLADRLATDVKRSVLTQGGIADSGPNAFVKTAQSVITSLDHSMNSSEAHEQCGMCMKLGAELEQRSQLVPMLVNVHRKSVLSGRLRYALPATLDGAVSSGTMREEHWFGAGGEVIVPETPPEPDAVLDGLRNSGELNVLGGADVLPLHCAIVSECRGGGGDFGDEDVSAPSAEDIVLQTKCGLLVRSQYARVQLNGKIVKADQDPIDLKHGDRIIIGRTNVFVYVHAPEYREQQYDMLMAGDEGSKAAGAQQAGATTGSSAISTTWRASALPRWEVCMREAHANHLGRLLKLRTVELARMQQGSAWQAPVEDDEDDDVKGSPSAAVLARIPRHHVHFVLLAAELGAIARQLGETEVFCAAYVSQGTISPGDGNGETSGGGGDTDPHGDAQRQNALVTVDSVAGARSSAGEGAGVIATMEAGVDAGGDGEELMVWLKVEELEADIPAAYWSFEKSQNRAALATEMFAHVAQRSSAGTDDGPKAKKKKRGRTQHARAAETKPASSADHRTENAFYDPPRAQTIGRARLYLDALGYLLEVDETLELIDYRGNPSGQLLVNIVPFVENRRFRAGEGEQWVLPNQDIDAKEQRLADRKGEKLHLLVRVRGARGVPQRLRHGVYASYTFFLDETPLVTDCCPHSTINPTFNYDTSVTEPITAELLEYVENATVDFELFGSQAATLGALSPYGHHAALRQHGDGKFKPVRFGLNDDGEGVKALPTAQDMHRLEEQLEDHERELGHARKNIQTLKDSEARNRADRAQLEEKLKKVREEYTNEKKEEIAKLREELGEVEKLKEELQARIHRYENSCASKMCVLQ